LGNKLRKERK